MSTPPADPPAGPPADTMTSIRAAIADELGKLFGAGKATVTDDPPTAEPTADIASQVRQAVKDVNAEQQQEASLTALIADVDQLKSSQQRAPKPIRRIERAMGWHRDDDD